MTLLKHENFTEEIDHLMMQIKKLSRLLRNYSWKADLVYCSLIIVCGVEKCKPSSKEDEAIHKTNQLICDDPRVENVLLTIRDGLHLVRKKTDFLSRSFKKSF